MDGNWGAFGVWSTCSATCGGGSQSRSRSCDDPSPANGGRPCSGSAVEQRGCGQQSCPGEQDNNLNRWMNLTYFA